MIKYILVALFLLGVYINWAHGANLDGFANPVCPAEIIANYKSSYMTTEEHLEVVDTAFAIGQIEEAHADELRKLIREAHEIETKELLTEWVEKQCGNN